MKVSIGTFDWMITTLRKVEDDPTQKPAKLMVEQVRGELERIRGSLELNITVK